MKSFFQYLRSRARVTVVISSSAYVVANYERYNKNDGMYSFCAARDNVVNQVFSSSTGTCVGTYSANDPVEDRNVYLEEAGYKVSTIYVIFSYSYSYEAIDIT